jgi:hypothetical protein
MTNLAWSRDNGDTTELSCGGTCTDRTLGLYTIQVTSAENPGTDTPETDDPATGWATLATVEYRRADPPDFNPPIEVQGFKVTITQAGKAILTMVYISMNREVDLVADDYYQQMMKSLTDKDCNKEPIMVLTTDGKGIIMRTSGSGNVPPES